MNSNRCAEQEIETQQGEQDGAPAYIAHSS